MLDTIWFVIWGVAWGVYFLLDGFDLGLGALLHFVAKTETDRRVAVNAMGPFWDGNEVWLVTAGGVTFAAFPTAYAVMFSALYTPFMILLLALILRGVAFEFRGKVDSAAWRKVWDASLAMGSFLAALLLGVAFANLFAGIPVDGEGVFRGSLCTFLHPYALAGGLFFVAAFLHHGALWLAVKSDGDLRERALAFANRLWFAASGMTLLFLGFTGARTSLWQNLSEKRPAFLAFPVLAVVGLVTSNLLSRRGKAWWAWGASALFIGGSVGFGVAGMFPNLVASSLDPAFSVTAFNAASSPLTLRIMLGIALCVLPLVIAYQAWVYVRFGHRVDERVLAEEPGY